VGPSGSNEEVAFGEVNLSRFEGNTCQGNNACLEKRYLEWAKDRTYTPQAAVEHSILASIFPSPKFSQTSATEAHFESTNHGNIIWGLVNIVPITDPYVGEDSLALIAACEAPPTQRASFESTCTEVLASFRPDQGWASRAGEAIVKENERVLNEEIAFFQGNTSYIQQLYSELSGEAQNEFAIENNTVAAVQATTNNSAQQWVAALGGNNLYQGPDGSIFPGPFGNGTTWATTTGGYIQSTSTLQSGDTVTGNDGYQYQVTQPVPIWTG
jgi:hypothetical protein